MVHMANKGLTALTLERLQPDGDRFTTYHVCSIPHRLVILVKRERLRGILDMPLLPLRG
jgi:hypothetical protein